MGDCDLFEVLNQLREKGIRDVLDDDPEDTASTRHEAARMGIGKIIQLFDGLPYTLGEPVAD